MIKGIVPALAEGGKIKIGGLGEERRKRDGGTFRLPMKLNHFLVTKNERDGSGDLIVDTDLMRHLPADADGKCREIPIVLHSDEIEEVFPTTLALYAGRKLFCRGDGETATRYEMKDKKRTGRTAEITCPCPFLNATSGHICKPHGVLHCSIRVKERALAGAVYKWRTTSAISIKRMLGSLLQIQQVCGTLCGIPLVLRLEKVDVTPDNAPASTVYCCHVELRATDLMQVQHDALEALKVRQQVRQLANYRALIAPPAVDETPEEEAEIQEEFHPEIEATDTGGNGHSAADPIETPRRKEKTDNGEPETIAFITPQQMKRMLAIAHGSKHSDESLRGWLKDAYDVDHFNEVPVSLYDSLVDRLKSAEPLPIGVVEEGEDLGQFEDDARE